MEVGIYSELQDGNALGGREFVVAVILEWCYAHGHDAEFVHHVPSLHPAQMAALFGCREEAARLRYLDKSASLSSWVRRNLGHEWQDSISATYDLFINIVHVPPARCRGRRGVLMVLFPFFDPSRLLPKMRGYAPIWKWPLMLFHHWRARKDLQAALATYNSVLSISRFTQLWTERRWGITSEVVYPPAEYLPSDSEDVERKENIILSVGRFSTVGVKKRQLELMRTFSQLSGNRPAGWTFTCAGSLPSGSDERALFESVRNAGKHSGGFAVPNLSRAELQDLYRRAAIFWHAAGYGEDLENNPELAEHFGIATVEAMFAGCVPVVIAAGAQPEIVEHGVSGFLWTNLQELKRYTRSLMADEDLRRAMSRNARQRAHSFSRSAFEARFGEVVNDMLESSQ